ncbi:hypothetical protein O1611_g5483 [Lasiodiplodia mahajangana]|uniref:Uncharacterized protein n=1 Tax=Lasiodiplodia mahajangana TaxID=1108764 RepID=A0ACC2JKV8_9PEZI|nr:hypothetical protein O1611_g5483 [Lasiodiplodia mahajangana]
MASSSNTAIPPASKTPRPVRKGHVLWGATVPIAKGMGEWLAGHGDHRAVESHEFDSLNIICSDLDIYTGKSSDGGEIFLAPFPLEKLRAAADKNGRSTKRKAIPMYFKRTPDLHDAWSLADEALSYVTHEGYVEKDGSIMYTETDWHRRGMHWAGGEKLHTKMHGVKGEVWEVEAIFDKYHEDTPHLQTLLADELEMRHDTLSQAELACIIFCTVARLRRKPYRHNRIVPITVVSTARRSARIVHAYIDASTGKLRVFKSQILEVSYDDNVFRSVVEILATWCIGQAARVPRWERTELDEYYKDSGV